MRQKESRQEQQEVNNKHALTTPQKVGKTHILSRCWHYWQRHWGYLTGSQMSLTHLECMWSCSYIIWVLICWEKLMCLVKKSHWASDQWRICHWLPLLSFSFHLQFFLLLISRHHKKISTTFKGQFVCDHCINKLLQSNMASYLFRMLKKYFS